MKKVSGAVSFEQNWSRAYLSSTAKNKVYLLLEVSGTARLQSNRPPVNLSLVLDRSGSMDGAPLAYCKHASQFVAEQLNEGDRLSLVVFDDEVQTAIAPTFVTNKLNIAEQISAIKAGGCTNLSGGLIEGSEHVSTFRKEGTISRVILLSDGHANRGILSSNQLASIAEGYHRRGITISALGVGDSFDEELLEQIAEAGGGNFYYINTPDRIPAIFEQELKGLLSVVAQNVKLNLSLGDGVHIENMHGYRFTQRAESWTVSFGDVYQEEQKFLLLEIDVSPRTPGRHPLLTVTWEFTDVIDGATARALSYTLEHDFTTDPALIGGKENTKVLGHVARVESAQAISQAIQAMDQGDIENGKQILLDLEQKKTILADGSQPAPVMIAESEQLLQALDQFDFSSSVRKQLHEQKYRHLKGKL